MEYLYCDLHTLLVYVCLECIVGHLNQCNLLHYYLLSICYICLLNYFDDGYLLCDVTIQMLPKDVCMSAEIVFLFVLIQYRLSRHNSINLFQLFQSLILTSLGFYIRRSLHNLQGFHFEYHKLYHCLIKIDNLLLM